MYKIVLLGFKLFLLKSESGEIKFLISNYYIDSLIWYSGNNLYVSSTLFPGVLQHASKLAFTQVSHMYSIYS